jgi:DNA end-binding protein Ku
VFEEIADFEAPDDMRALAAELIERNSGPFDPEIFEDRYEQALIALVRSRGPGRAKSAPGVKEPKTPSNVVSLMEALKRSIQAQKSAAPAKAAEPKVSAVKGSRKKESGRAGPAPVSIPAKATARSAQKTPGGKPGLRKAS